MREQLRKSGQIEDGRIVKTMRLSTMKAAMTHNAGHQHAPVLSMSLRECAQTSCAVVAKSADSPAEFGEGDGLKNRCRFERKSWIPQVLTSRTLSVCGEVAERLKAAVC